MGLGGLGIKYSFPLSFSFLLSFFILSYNLHRTLDIELPVSTEGLSYIPRGQGQVTTAARQASAKRFALEATRKPLGATVYFRRPPVTVSPFSTRGTNTWTLCQGHPLKGQASRARRSQDGGERDSVGPLARLITLSFQHRLSEEVIPRSVLEAALPC